MKHTLIATVVLSSLVILPTGCRSPGGLGAVPSSAQAFLDGDGSGTKSDGAVCKDGVCTDGSCADGSCGPTENVADHQPGYDGAAKLFAGLNAQREDSNVAPASHQVTRGPDSLFAPYR